MKGKIATLLCVLPAILLSFHAGAATIAVIGTGDVGSALGPEFAAQGHTIIYGSREPQRADVVQLVQRTGSDASAAQPASAVENADIVVLAVPGTAAVDIARSLGDLAGKILLDPSNVIDRAGEEVRHGAPGKSSNAQMIQAVQPRANVVKAFNTVNWRVMVDPEIAGGPVTIPLAGDNNRAKAVVAELIEGMGLHAVDVGPLEFAHTLEEMLIMWINALGTDNAYNFYLRPTP